MTAILLTQPSPLPPELWIEILWHACAIQGVEEFSTDPERYIGIYSMEGDFTTSGTHEQLSVALECRQKMVLVCRSWAALAIPILWSHLRLPPQLPTLLETLRRKPHLGLCVRRISNPWRLLHLEPECNNLQDIINLCPHSISIEILALLTTTGITIPESVRNLALSLQRPFPIIHQRLTSLRLNFRHQSPRISSFPPLELPALRALNITNMALYDHWVDGIIEWWSLPCLQSLALSGRPTHLVLRILDKFALTMKTVKLFTPLKTTEMSTQPVQLDMVSRLDIPWSNVLADFQNLLRLPNLQTILVHWPFHREIPILEVETLGDVTLFCVFVRGLHMWCSHSTLIAFECGDYAAWLLRQRKVVEALSEIRGEGRRVMLPEQAPRQCIQPIRAITGST